MLFSGVRKVDNTIEPYAQWWDRQNHDALHSNGPLWVVFGDSVTQGIGASKPEHGYVPHVLGHLRNETGEPWRVINLSMSGARFADVVNPQLPTMREASLEPQLVTALIGSNDVIWRRNVGAIVADARRLVQQLPAGTILSRLGEPRPDRRRIDVNAVFDDAAERGHLRQYQAWDWPSGAGMWAEDNFHPNDRAHELLAANLVDALDRHGIT